MEENNENSKKFKTVQDPNAYKKVLKKFNINNIVQLKRKDAQSLIDRIEAAIAIEKAKAEAAS